MQEATAGREITDLLTEKFCVCGSSLFINTIFPWVWGGGEGMSSHGHKSFSSMLSMD